MTASTGTELWKSDGTAAGTVLVKDINPRRGQFVAPMAVQKQVDGPCLVQRPPTTTHGIRAVEERRDGGGHRAMITGHQHRDPERRLDGTSSPPWVNGVTFFIGNDGTNGSGAVEERWDGGRYCPGKGHPPRRVELVAPAVHFAVWAGPYTSPPTTASNGTELWKNDGTAAGTVLVRDIRPGALSSAPEVSADPAGTGDSPAAAVENIGSLHTRARVDYIFFLGQRRRPTAQELWRSDGTASGTVLVKDINPRREPARTPRS